MALCSLDMVVSTRKSSGVDAPRQSIFFFRGAVMQNCIALPCADCMAIIADRTRGAQYCFVRIYIFFTCIESRMGVVFGVWTRAHIPRAPPSPRATRRARPKLGRELIR